MITLKFKNNPCEEHLKVETSDDWCPYCLMAELETLRNLQTRVKNAFEQVDMSIHEGGLGATVEELVLRCMAKDDDIADLRKERDELRARAEQAEADAERLANFIKHLLRGALRGNLSRKALELLDQHRGIEPEESAKGR